MVGVVVGRRGDGDAETELRLDRPIKRIWRANYWREKK